MAIGQATGNYNFIFLIFPLIARALGIFATLVGMPFVKLTEAEAKHPMKALRKGLLVTTIVSGVLFFLATVFLLGGNMYLFYCLLAGLAASVAIDYITDYYTGRDRGPVIKIAKASETGSATNIITGFAVGLETTALPIVSLAIALLASYWFGTQFAISLGTTSTGAPILDPFIGGIYGTTLATMGMLAVMGMVLALDGFGPIADNAAGIAEMSGEGGAEATMEALDAVGNTTKALTKGFALGSALLAAQLLFQTYLEEVFLQTGVRIAIDISNPAVLVAGFIGAMMPFFFSSQAISAVGKAAGEMVDEVRRQFREIPGIMDGTGKPDYGRAVDISTKSALKGMVLPALIVVVVPLIVGILMGPEAVGALVIGATLSAVPLSFVNEYRRWCMGQCKEVHRSRTLRRKELPCSFCSSSRRHSRRPNERHSRTKPPRTHKATINAIYSLHSAVLQSATAYLIDSLKREVSFFPQTIFLTFNKRFSN